MQTIFETTDTQAMIAESIREFAALNISPNIMDWDEKPAFFRLNCLSNLETWAIWVF